MNQSSFEKLENALVNAGHLIDYPKPSSVATQVQARLDAKSLRPPLRWAFTFAILLILAVLAVPATRNAFSQFFGVSNLTATPFITPTLAMTPRPEQMTLTLTSSPTTQTLAPSHTYAGTPSTWASSVDIRLLAKPVAHPNDPTNSE